MRATGQGFGFNFGRIIAAAGNLQMANLQAQFQYDYAQARTLVAGVNVMGLVLIFVFAGNEGETAAGVERTEDANSDNHEFSSRSLVARAGSP